MRNAAQSRVLGLLVTDSFRWKHDWAAWRIRFAYDNDHRGRGFRDVKAFLRESAAPHCRARCECDDNMLYLQDATDVKSVFAAFGAISHGLGEIAAIQSHAAYAEAAALAAELAAQSHEPDSPAEADAMALPDLSWDVVGFGLSRVATAHVRGQKVAVR
ncbi:MAG TPA: hypothetical protein VGC80_18105, partial [Acetobacteraceae bacterium]